MKYLLIMSLSGSTMVGIYLLLRYLLKDKMSARMQYMLAKTAVLFYLIPLPFLKKWYESAVRYVMPGNGMKVSQVSTAWAGYVVHTSEKVYTNTYMKVQTAAVLLWLLISILLLMYELIDYIQTRKKILCFADRMKIQEESDFLEELKKRYGIKRKIAVYRNDIGERTMSFGFFKPVILCDQKMGSLEAELILCHELIHVRRCDAVWKILRQLAFYLHWWNPVAWFLYYDFEKICEWSCDEIVIQGRPKSEIKIYLRLLIAEAAKENRSSKTRMRWGISFAQGSARKRLEKRMENVMKMKKWNKTVAGIVAVGLVMVNSLTVFAYEDTIRGEYNENSSQEEIDNSLEGEIWQFIPEEICEEQLNSDLKCLQDNIEIIYDEQFVDENGTVYQIQRDMKADVYRSCTHDYVSGTHVTHTSKSGGGCVVRSYSAQKCSKCGYLIIGSKISETTYVVCPH